jgi:hypothetical protein
MIQEFIQRLDYDSRLFTALASASRNADLILIIRVHLIQKDPPLHRPTQFGSDRRYWGSPAEWANWCRSLKDAVEGAWNNKLWLVPSADWGCDWPRQQPTHRPNVKCGLKLEFVSASGNPHLTIDCYRSEAQMVKWSYIYPHPTSTGVLQSRDVWVTDQHPTGTPSELHKQVVAAHEFGHYLLGTTGHVACDSSAEICYGKTRHQRDDMMGMGGRIEGWHARPWLGRIKEHLLGVHKAVQWKAVAGGPAGGPRPIPIP